MKYDSSSLVLVHCVNTKDLKVIKNEDMKIMYEKEGINIKIAESYQFKNMEEIMNHMNDLSYQIQGVVIKYNNNRTKIRNQNYNFVKVIRGNTPKLFTHYLDLKKKKLIKQYLYYYPEFKPEFDEFNSNLTRMINLLHHCYIGYHINKKIPEKAIRLETIPYELRPLIYELHGHHLKSQKQIKITNEYVKNYFNNLPIGKILFVMNYQKNQKKNKN